MTDINSLLNFINDRVKSDEDKNKLSMDDLLYNSIMNTLNKSLENYKDDFKEKVVLDFLIAGDDAGYSLSELEGFIKEIKS